MDPRVLLPPESTVGYPAPFWFLQALKVLGFALHVLPMHIWYAGALIAAVCGIFFKGDTRRVGYHIARALPFALAFGINFGILPLLIHQAAYYQFFYPATILMAWPWFFVFWLVLTAYYAIYLYRLTTIQRMPARIGKLGGLFAAGAFLLVGFIFANAMSLLSRPENWWGIFKSANAAGSATGIALNLHDPTLLPRWLFMFAFAITTTATYVSVDAAFLSGKETEQYRRFASRFAILAYTIGLIAFVGFGSWYIFGTRMDMWQAAIAHPFMRIIFPLTMISPGLPWLLIVLQWKNSNRRLAALAAVAQFGSIGLNAISRQWVQNMELAPYANLAQRHVNMQTSALIVFLALLLGGMALIGWMIAKMIEANRGRRA